MILHDCQLTFHDTLFYETRTLGRLYETGRLLHNIALSYALGLARSTYHHDDYVPRYAEELAPLNEQGIYVTPATDEAIHFVVHTFKFGEERTAVRMEKSNANIPTYGRAKEIGVGSVFRFGVLAPQPLNLPSWIRMGIWMSKARLSITQIKLERSDQASTQTLSRYPVNPGDLPESVAVRVFDLVSMRPTNLLQHVELYADAWWKATLPHGEIFRLPVGLHYGGIK
jgi:CRISPR-associated protein Csc1